MATTKRIIKMPNTVTNLKQYKEWVNSMRNINFSLFVTMKRRSNYEPQDMRERDNGVIDYLITDSVSSGSCTIKRFNQVFKFTLITYK